MHLSISLLIYCLFLPSLSTLWYYYYSRMLPSELVVLNEVCKTAYIISANCPVTVEKRNQNYVFQVMPNTWQTSKKECKAYASEECNKYGPDHKHSYNKTIEEGDLKR